MSEPKVPKTMLDVFEAEEVIETDPKIQRQVWSVADRLAKRLNERDAKNAKRVKQP